MSSSSALPNYRQRVSTMMAKLGPQGEEEGEKEKGKDQRKRVEAAKKLGDLLENLAWVAVGGYTWYITDFHNVIISDQKLSWWWFSFAIFLFSCFLAVGLFFRFYLPKIQKRIVPTDEWEMTYPRLFPFATICLLLSLICCLFAFWPVFRIYTPVVLFFIGMGLFMLCLVVL